MKVVAILLAAVIWLSISLDKEAWNSLSKEQQMNLIPGLKTTYCVSEDTCEVDVIIRRERNKVTITLTNTKRGGLR